MIIFFTSTQIPGCNQSVSESALVPGKYPTLHGKKKPLQVKQDSRDSTLLLFRFGVASGSEQRVLATAGSAESVVSFLCLGSFTTQKR